METFDYSFVFNLSIAFVLSMLIILGCYFILRKINHKSGFWCYSYDFPYWRKYNKKK